MAFKIQFPYYAREALVVSQVVAAHVWHNHAFEATGEEATDTVARIPIPPVGISANRNEKGARVRVSFPMGTVVVAELRPHSSLWGEYWTVSAVKSRFYLTSLDRELGEKKGEKVWEGDELYRISALWGNSPRVEA